MPKRAVEVAHGVMVTSVTLTGAVLTGVMLALGMARFALAQDDTVQQPFRTSAASAYPYTAIDRPGTRSSNERSRVNPGTAATSQASAREAPEQDSGAAR
jgi:hypothetical protein